MFGVANLRLLDIVPDVILRGSRACLPLLLLLGFSWTEIHAQIDPEKRRIIHLGYNQYLEGRGPVAAYGFFYYNKPNFLATNMTLRLAAAPIYLDAELGFSRLLGPNTDFALGAAGGGFAETYSEMREGIYRRDESFTGHGGEFSSSVFHLFNPGKEVPLWLILRGTVHQAAYLRDRETHPRFRLPDDLLSFKFRTGLRYGGQEPLLTAPLGMELSIWHESLLRTWSGTYGFAGDRRLEKNSHLFWGRSLLRYTFEPSMQRMDVSLTAGVTLNADRFSAYRLGGFLPFVAEFPLSIPGYYFQEISAEKFILFNSQYTIPLDRTKNWRFTPFGSAAVVDYLPGLEQPENWHAGAGAGLTYVSPTGAWLITLTYGHGFNAIRNGRTGANNIGLVFQYDFDARHRGRYRPFEPHFDPYRSRGGERILFR